MPREEGGWWFFNSSPARSTTQYSETATCQAYLQKLVTRYAAVSLNSCCQQNIEQP
ncbi:hypothetical protein M404DRAFT_1007974 [Pisolithus tinctorius Marx 270]|uniref:Uncharacterized protein n=1 Tax=Pisolithus tinctorius Marx 270 TaxID=870435 RepID=A0A0C3JBA3_PISTI|nr:hypothetical protein M404DRAFT_1007974 [Pisolithus tinctorius Marx 270]